MGLEAGTYDIQYTVGDDLGVNADLGGTLSQRKDDGVPDPKDNGHSGGYVEDFSYVGGLEGCCLTTGNDDAVEDNEEELEVSRGER